MCRTCSTRSGVVGWSNVEAISSSETGRKLVLLVPPAEVPGPVDERDDVQGQALSSSAQFQVGQLLGQVVLERLRPLDDVLHRVELAVAQLVEGGPAGPVLVLVEHPVPVAVEGFEPLELQFGPGVGRRA